MVVSLGTGLKQSLFFHAVVVIYAWNNVLNLGIVYCLASLPNSLSKSWSERAAAAACAAGEEREAVPEAAAAVHPDHLHAARRRDPAQQPC